MKPSIKKHVFLLILISLLGIAGCTTTGKSAKDESAKKASIQDSQNIVDSSLAVAVKNKAILPTAQRLQSYSNSFDIQTGRYSTIKSKPTHSQRELLQVMITVSIPDDIISIGQTIRYLLKRSGYQLDHPKAQQTELTELLAKRLPEVHRQLGPMTLEDALIILAAPAFTLYEDPVQRLISYKLDIHYSGEIG